MENEFKKGWTVLFSCFIGVGVSLVSLIYYSNGIWIKPLEEEFGWSRAEIGLGQGLGMLTLVIGAPFAGWLIDRFGLNWCYKKNHNYKKNNFLSGFVFAKGISINKLI